MAEATVSPATLPAHADAVAQAKAEIEIMLQGGAALDTQHERRDLLTFVAHKHGVSPDELFKTFKIQPSRGQTDAVIEAAWQLMLGRLPQRIKAVVADLEFRIEDQSPDDPNLEGETFPEHPPTKGFVIYRRAFPKARVTAIAQVMAHEVWHVFAEWSGFYERLEDVLTEKLDRWLHFGIADAKEFVAVLEMLEQGAIGTDFQRRLKQKIIGRKWWGESYFLEQAEADKLKGVLGRVKSPLFKGAIDELMAECLGRIVTGKSLLVPGYMVKFMLEI